MPSYSYSGIDAKGKTTNGFLQADSIQVLEQKLKESGIWMMKATQDSKTVVSSKTETTQQSRVKVKRWELINFYIQFSLLLRAGINLPKALRRLSDDLGESRLGKVLQTIAEQVEIGVPLNEAISYFPRIFPPETVSIIRAGEVSGNLPNVLDEIRLHLEWTDKLTSDIRQALIYPCIVITAATGLILFLFPFTVPKFVTLLNELALELPALTQYVMIISDFLKSYLLIILTVLFLIPVLYKIIRKTKKGGIFIDRMMMNLPIFGNLIQMFGFSRFSKNLSMLYRSGIPILKGLQITQSVMGNLAIREAVTATRKAVEEGTPLSQGLARIDIFPKILVTMIATGEESGSLDESLNSVAGYYDEIIPRKIKALFTFFEPVVMLTLIGIVGAVALSVILPILQLWSV